MLKVQNFQSLTGTEYLLADIACKHDKSFEKKHWNERIAHFHEIDFKDEDTFMEASNPIGLRGAYLNYEKALRGKPTGHMISLDASSSVLQLLSLLIGCPQSFSLSGGDENILDGYRVIHEGTGLQANLSREQVKESCMQAYYGSTATPKRHFGEKNVWIFYETMRKLTPGAWRAKTVLEDLWDHVPGHFYEWTLPNNFYAHIATRDERYFPIKFAGESYEVKKIIEARPDYYKGLAPNLVHSVDGLIATEMCYRCMFNGSTLDRVAELVEGQSRSTNGRSANMVKILWEHYEMSGFLSTRILDYLHHDTIGLVDRKVINNMIRSFPERPFDLVTRHDCFNSHANYGNDVRKQYNRILADISDSNLLVHLMSQVVKDTVKLNKVGYIPREVILSCNYTLS